MVKTLNNGMKGTDLIDQLKVCYEIDRRYPKKFYLKVFFDLMDISYVNAFIVYTKYMQDKFPHSVPIFIKLYQFLIKTVVDANCIPSKK